MIAGTPIAIVSLIDEDRQWFKSRRGVTETQTPRDLSLCAQAILDQDRPLIVEDARKDPRFAANPYVTGDRGIRFYLGAPLVSPGGHALGTLCVIDRQPRSLRRARIESLEALSRLVVDQLELRRVSTELLEAQRALRAGLAERERLADQLEERVREQIGRAHV